MPRIFLGVQGVSMSFQVYDAYKVKRRDQLWPLLREIQDRGRANVIQRFKEIYWDRMIHLDPENETLKKYCETYGIEWPARLRTVNEELKEFFKASAVSRERGEGDIDVSVSVYEHPSGFYLRVNCDQVSCLRGCLDFVHTHTKVRDFHFQNSSNRPRKVSARDWMTRRRVWDELVGKGGILRPLVVVPICNWSLYWTMDPHLVLADEYRKSPPTLPIPEEVQAQRLRKIPELGEVLADDGVIQAEPSGLRIRRGKKVWASSFKGKLVKRHKSLLAAVEHVRFQYLPEHMKRTLERMMKDAKRRTRKAS